MDLCRHSIIFNSVSEVARCLAAIGRDQDVAIVRIKNRLDPKFDSAMTAGYRNVALNLCITTEETKSLGVETHVCEVQLLLICMAEIKVPVSCNSALIQLP